MRKQIVPLDPDSPAGQAAAESLSQALAEILPKVLARRRVVDGVRPGVITVRDPTPPAISRYRKDRRV